MKALFFVLSLFAFAAMMQSCASKSHRLADENTPVVVDKETADLTIIAEPLSYGSAIYSNVFSTAICFDASGVVALALCESRRLNFFSKHAAFEAYLKLELADGDHEPLTMVGSFDKQGDFIVSSLTCSGRRFTFR